MNTGYLPNSFYRPQRTYQIDSGFDQGTVENRFDYDYIAPTYPDTNNLKIQELRGIIDMLVTDKNELLRKIETLSEQRTSSLYTSENFEKELSYMKRRFNEKEESLLREINDIKDENEELKISLKKNKIKTPLEDNNIEGNSSLAVQLKALKKENGNLKKINSNYTAALESTLGVIKNLNRTIRKNDDDNNNDDFMDLNYINNHLTEFTGKMNQIGKDAIKELKSIMKREDQSKFNEKPMENKFEAKEIDRASSKEKREIERRKKEKDIERRIRERENARKAKQKENERKSREKEMKRKKDLKCTCKEKKMKESFDYYPFADEYLSGRYMKCEACVQHKNNTSKSLYAVDRSTGAIRQKADKPKVMRDDEKNLNSSRDFSIGNADSNRHEMTKSQEIKAHMKESKKILSSMS